MKKRGTKKRDKKLYCSVITTVQHIWMVFFFLLFIRCYLAAFDFWPKRASQTTNRHLFAYGKHNFYIIIKSCTTQNLDGSWWWFHFCVTIYRLILVVFLVNFRLVFLPKQHFASTCGYRYYYYVYKKIFIIFLLLLWINARVSFSLFNVSFSIHFVSILELHNKLLNRTTGR